MKDVLRPPNLPEAPDQFDPRFFDDYSRRLTQFFEALLAPGECNVDTLRILGAPESSVGLSAFSVWVDGGTLKIVLATALVEPTGLSVTAEVGTVTVQTP